MNFHHSGIACFLEHTYKLDSICKMNNQNMLCHVESFAKFCKFFRLLFFLIQDVYIFAPKYMCNSRSIRMQAYFMKGFLKHSWCAKNALFPARVQLVA